MVSLELGSVVFEVKQGPYLPLSAPDLAGWSPAEGEASVAKMLEFLTTAKPGEYFVA